MAEFCTCGAQLPEDARFCHKCGKPQREQPPVEEMHPAELPLAEREPAPAPEISFHNRPAVRIGFLAAGLAWLLMLLPIPGPMAAGALLVWLLGAGIFSVFLYGRRTGERLSPRSGARLGWITGIFCFVIGTVFFTLTMIVISLQGGFAEFYRKYLEAQGLGSAGSAPVLETLQSPAGLVVIVLTMLALLFFLFTMLPTLGGLLGAKMLRKD